VSVACAASTVRRIGAFYITVGTRHLFSTQICQPEMKAEYDSVSEHTWKYCAHKSASRGSPVLVLDYPARFRKTAF
jgi:hypothetical protein